MSPVDKRYLRVSKYLAYVYAWIYTLGLVVSYFTVLANVEGALNGEEAFQPVWFGVELALGFLFLVILLRFREVLDRKLDLHTFDILIPAVAIAQLFLIVMGSLPGRLSSVIGALPLAVIALRYGIRLLSCPHDLFGVRGTYAFAMIATGGTLLSLILAPIAPIFWAVGSFALASFFARAEAQEFL